MTPIIDVTLRNIDFKARLPGIVDKVVVGGDPIQLTATGLYKIALRTFWELVFRSPINAESEDIVIASLVAWRNEVSQKATTYDVEAKMAAVRVFWDAITKLPFLNAEEEADKFSQHPHHMGRRIVASAIMQPFFISPMINYVDILHPLVEEL